ncbi:MAG: branched-chain amino acid aminotransferase [Pseudomonadota bacterium]
MATGTRISTFYEGKWHDGDVPIMRAADHGSWVGSTVFDGARHFDGRSPDLLMHCARANRSAVTMGLEPTMSPEAMVEAIEDGLKRYAPSDAVYIRPMYWGIDGDPSGIVPVPERTGFAICLEVLPMLAHGVSVTLGKTRFRRPVMEDNLVDCKAGCLYPNNARMLREVRARGFGNALVVDAMGNVAESATANVFMARDGVVFTPIPNGTFLAGITRARHIANMRADGIEVVEKVLTFADFEAADEVFLSGNMMKVTPVSGFEDTSYQVGPVTRRVKELYWDWAAS